MQPKARIREVAGRRPAMTKTVLNTDISIVRYNEEDYISLTDMARSQMQEHIIFRWLSLKSTLEYLGEWEILYNPDFNCTEFGTIKNAAGSNNFVLVLAGMQAASSQSKALSREVRVCRPAMAKEDLRSNFLIATSKA